MKATDKFLEVMLDDIRKAAVRASNSASGLSSAITDLQNTFSGYCRLQRGIFKRWKLMADRAMIDFTMISTDAEELADAEDETAEGGGE